MKLLKSIFNFFRKIRRRYIIAKATPKMEKAFRKQLILRRVLRADVNIFLRQYFGIDANSKFIPADFKNPEEVKTAVIAKFNTRMGELNVNYSDMFK